MKKTINLRINAIGMIGLTSAALLLPAMAIEKPAEWDAPKAAEKPAQKVAMLGVGGMKASGYGRFGGQVLDFGRVIGGEEQQLVG